MIQDKEKKILGCSVVKRPTEKITMQINNFKTAQL